jgi:transcriptional regulator with XRE-family HTH domain
VHGNIKRLRIERGLTQAELGAAVEADNTVVSHWERGESAPGIDRLPAVAAALGVTVDDLLSNEAPRRTAQRKATRRAS